MADPSRVCSSFAVQVIGEGAVWRFENRLGDLIAYVQESKMPVVLSQGDLRELLSMKDVIEAVEKGFGEYKSGQCFVPVRMPVKIEKEDGIFLFMPAYLGNQNAFGTKMISVFPENAKRGLSTLQAAYVLNNPTTGEILALMDGILLTAMRTGATSAVATKYMARKDAAVLGIIGAGAQAPFQAEAVCAVRRIRQILIFDVDPVRVQRCTETISKRLGTETKVSGSPKDLVSQSDILITVTTSKEPVFDGHDLKAGVHINAVGAYTPEMRELDDVTLNKARIVVDTHEGCMAEAGDLLIPIKAGQLAKEDIYADLGEVVLGQKAGRENTEEITVFESVGFALEDLVTAQLAYDRAREKGLGLEFHLQETS